MVDWKRRFPNLANFEVAHFKKRYDVARTAKEKKQVLRDAENKIMRFPNSSASNVTARQGKKIPERVLDMGWRMGKLIHDNPRGVEMFMEIMILLLKPNFGASKAIIAATRAALPPLNVTKESTSERLERVYGLSSAFIGDVVKFDALLNSNEVVSVVEVSLYYMFVFAIVMRLLIIGSEKSRKMVTDVLDGIGSIVRLPGYAGLFLSFETMMKTIVVMHVRLFMYKVSDVYASKLLPPFVRTMIKNVVPWARGKINLDKYIGTPGKVIIEFLFGAIIDMRYAPKSVVRQTAKLLKVVNKTTAPAKSLPATRGTRTPMGSRNNGGNVAESPARPPRSTARVTGEGVSSPLRLKVSGNNGKTYLMSNRQWNSLSNARNDVPSTSRVELRYRNQVRYARRSDLTRV